MSEPEIDARLHAEISEAKAGMAHHAPNGERTVSAHQVARMLHQNLVGELLWLLPPGRDRSLVRTHLEDSLMRTNRAIALHGGPADHVTDEQLRDRYEEMFYSTGPSIGE